MPEKYLCIPDTLSRAPIPSLADSFDLQVLAEAFISSAVLILPATPAQITNLQVAQLQDEILSQVLSYRKEGWPEKNLKGPIKKFWMTRNELSLHDDLLFHGSRIVVPLLSLSHLSV